jgi:transcriptional regulator with PAS, ATPase and Fis domain
VLNLSNLNDDTVEILNMNKTNIIGESPAIIEVKDTAGKLANNQYFTTLIVGENGTGKELVAKLIHCGSSNSDRPFIDINCGAIPESLLESELFGHEKGAFTGAHAMKKGLFELAEGGSVFLDEIGNMPLNLQSKVLKTVETKRIRRIGGLKEINITARIIAATNVDLLEAVKKGQFREDLYYRLNVGHIKVPPLRDRADDVLLLAQYFIDNYSKQKGQEIKGLTPAAREIIKEYSWPGNIRELQNTIARVVLLETDEWISAENLNLDISTIMQTVDKSKALESKTRNSPLDDFKMPTKGIALEELERNIINSALEKASGNLSHAARLLKISRGKLRYRLEKLGINF